MKHAFEKDSARTSRQVFVASTSDACADSTGSFFCPTDLTASLEPMALPITNRAGHDVEKAVVPSEPGAVVETALCCLRNSRFDQLNYPGRGADLITRTAGIVKFTAKQVARFFAQVNVNGPICAHLGTACHLWTGAVNHRGYGVTKIGGRSRQAHAVATDIAGIGVPEGMVRRHLCGVKLCVNVDHVKPGTQEQNANDTEPANRKVTEEQAAQIRADYAAATAWGAKGIVFDAWAAKLGVTRRCVEYIAHRQTYIVRHPLKPGPYRKRPANDNAIPAAQEQAR